jgi:hypothetical protein
MKFRAQEEEEEVLRAQQIDNTLRAQLKAAGTEAGTAARRSAAALVLQCWARQCAARAAHRRKLAAVWADYERAEEDALATKQVLLSYNCSFSSFAVKRSLLAQV